MKGDLTWGGEETIQYTNDVLWNCTLETYIINQCHPNKFNTEKKSKENPKFQLTLQV